MKIIESRSVGATLGEENITRITMDDYYKDQSDMPLEEINAEIGASRAARRADER